MLLSSQANRPLRIETPLGPDRLLLVGLQGSEELSGLFRFELDLLAPVGLPIDFAKLMAKPVSVILENGGIVRYLNGIATEVAQGRDDEEFTHYRMTLSPKLWWLTQAFRSRVFQQMTVVEILSEVLTGIEMRLELAETYPSRNYCTQYQESDFAFASRLMEEEGIFYFFEFEEGKHTLVLSDSNLRLPKLGQPNPITFEQLQGGSRDDLRIGAWTKNQRVRTTAVELRDHDFQLPDQSLQADESIQMELNVGTVKHVLVPEDDEAEVYEYPGGYAKRFDGVGPGGEARPADPPRIFEDNLRTAKLRMQQFAAGAIEIKGTSNCNHLTSGYTFTLRRHPHADGDYVLRRVEHRARLDLAYRSDAQDARLEYDNKFVCLPVDLPYRCERKTSRPKIAGVQTATVVGPPAAEIFCDKYGRVKVQFHWDREGRNNADSSCWLRVAQLWAGNRWGAFFWPRVGHEVVVAFVEGDPDRPLIVGSVYNAANMPPPELPAEATVGGIKSCIFGGEPLLNFNALLFHDTPGHEFVQVHSEKNEIQHSESNKFHYVPNAQFSFYGNFQ